MSFIVEPVPSQLKPREQILALGTDTRQRISWSKSGRIFSLLPKKEFSDLSEFYARAARVVKNKVGLNPRILTFDPHPHFISCLNAPGIRDAYFPEARLKKIFHHVAHVAGFGLDVGAHKRYIGLAFDGTGYGPDNRIWGGEFFVYSSHRFRRVAHFDDILLPGNEAAIRQPWRVALAAGHRLFGRKILNMGPVFLKGISPRQQELVIQLLEKEFNTPTTSSAGRLFDAVSAMLGLKRVVKKEAEAAVALEEEAALCQQEAPAFAFDIKDSSHGLCLDFSPMLKEILALKPGVKTRRQAARGFHVTIAFAAARVCRILRQTYRINTVYASGGVFMNKILTSDLERILKKDGFRVFFAKRPFTTDIGISAGQIAAAEMMKVH